MKAAIAAGAAGALMFGGAGTFALWNGSGDVSAGTVTTGHLLLDTAAAGVWQDVSVPATPVAFNPATDTIVPGDIVEYKQTVTIDADGDLFCCAGLFKDWRASVPRPVLPGGFGCRWYCHLLCAGPAAAWCGTVLAGPVHHHHAHFHSNCGVLR
ncbi:alternate-type signal peptide domain-containing protein [Arthrobacter sp. TMN-49]